MTGFNGVVTAVCFAQTNPDPEMRSAVTLTEDVLGIIDGLVLRVITALQFWNPFDPATVDPVTGAMNTYLREPCRMTDGGFGLNPIDAGDAWWVSAPIDFECKLTSAFSR